MEPIKQNDFVDLIKNALPPGHSLVGELSDLLNISSDSAYRRIRGETSFTFEEVVIICNRFSISFDSFISSQSGSVSFRYNMVDITIGSFKKYIQKICTDLVSVRQSRDRQIIYAADDIPIFLLFAVPEVAYFKMFYWMKSVLNIPELEKMKYDPSFIDEDLRKWGEEMLNSYSIVPSIEIWNDTTFTSIIKEIDFYHESGLFQSEEQALNLCDRLSELLNDIRKMAERSSKREGLADNYLLYNSDVEVGNNCILATAGQMQALYIRHYTFNILVTTDKTFCEETSQWLNGLIRKSTLISGVSEKQRYQFFQKAQECVEKLKSKIRS